MLTKKTPDTIRAELKITAQGVENTLLLTYFNRSYEEYQAFVQNPENLKPPEGVTGQNEAMAHMNASIALHIVKSFDDGTDEDFPLTRAGLVSLEQTWPGTLMGLVRGYHQSRAAAVEKN